MALIKYCKLPFHFDQQLLQQDLQQLLEKSWQPHYQKLHYEGGWSALPLRSVNGDPDNIIVSPNDAPVYKDTVFLDKCPYYKAILSQFQCPLQSVRLLKLNAGAVIKEHKDAELNFEQGEARLHIPVITNKNVEFILDGEPLHLKQGECWYMNVNLKHSVANRGTEDRIHLVIDAKVNDWISDLFLNRTTDKAETSETDYDISVKQQMILMLREMGTETGNKLADEMEATLNNP
ncbi:MAG: aspartyl/asparaginyl beta-hydroxylase domain-containing protein [Chitinophagaceae bacterium]|nr:aspartyl/asparaginyl beta-hydroxylase domain-containing protein [Chitinophagaceae bacterium]